MSILEPKALTRKSGKKNFATYGVSRIYVGGGGPPLVGKGVSIYNWVCFHLAPGKQILISLRERVASKFKWPKETLSELIIRAVKSVETKTLLVSAKADAVATDSEHQEVKWRM